ncbi:DUF6636 domain-containing protein [Merismopedia glauca]|uniref:DUF1036 domain-containing protein n=1 Tax=Merismopedia glauca CCAP 1448/3 TaxID=1296344 RepID=A0A2T1C5K3_9CYAN|nr:DUF6636 domain-containing protein [Merismopedia glauca]PSB03562.1 hypothetical protein C7B64_07885 [Merismopedia glauca CCAP 1448/3]
MKTKTALVFWVLSLAAPAFAQDFGTIGAFQTPSGNIHCLAFKNSVTNEVNLRCDMKRNTAQIPPKPANCEFDWGNYFEMNAVGKANRKCVGDTVIGDYAVLPYGKKWVIEAAFSCNVSRSRLRCVNTNNHGFELAVKKQKLF